MVQLTETRDTLTFSWQMTLDVPPEKLWPYLADTDRLNHDFGFSPITRLDADAEQDNNRRRAKQVISGFWTQVWREEPFQWSRPHRYHTMRVYERGLFRTIEQRTTLTERAGGGMDLFYEIAVSPRIMPLRPLIRQSFLGLPLEQTIKRYVTLIHAEREAELKTAQFIAPSTNITDEGQARLNNLIPNLTAQNIPQGIAQRLADYLRTADDLSLMRIKPYALADFWREPRLAVLEACLAATRVGVLDMSWDLICPHCRGAKRQLSTLHDMTGDTHCESCHIDFSIDFERSVELTFRPNAAIRPIKPLDYCVGGPEVTPHIHVQQLIGPHESVTLDDVRLPTGRFRIRTQTLSGGQFVQVAQEGQTTYTLQLSDTWPTDEPTLTSNAQLAIENATDSEQLLIIEHLVWSDQSATAADVTTRQLFRDLFASEALRPNEQITVQSVTLVFTDLRSSTAMYQELGDAPAFGTVMSHFDVLRAAIRQEEGAIVKTIGDAVMAAFRQPDAALRAMLSAQATLRTADGNRPALTLRVGVHTGTCIMVTLNERLDYFGTTVNTAARLEGQSDGDGAVISEATYNDPAVQHLLTSDVYSVEPFQAPLKGLGDKAFQLYRVRLNI